MSNNSKDVELIPDSQIPSKWKLKYGGNTGNGPSNYPKIKLDEDSGPALITFTLPEDAPMKFSANPIWVAEGTNSPLQKGVDDQIGAVKVFDAGKTLVILDRNTEDVELGYRLNFDGYASLDPIIDNGGGRKFLEAWEIIALLAGAALFLLLGRWWERTASRRNTASSPTGTGATHTGQDSDQGRMT